MSSKVQNDDDDGDDDQILQYNLANLIAIFLNMANLIVIFLQFGQPDCDFFTIWPTWL